MENENEPEPNHISCIASNLIIVQKQLTIYNEYLEACRCRIGQIECLSIMRYHMNVDELNNKIKILRDKVARVADLPLYHFIAKDGSQYNITLVRIDQLMVGEYESVEDLLVKLDPEDANKLRGNVNILEERLLANSITVYDSLTTQAKTTGKGPKFRGLITSNRRKYLYRYLPDKKHVLGFIATKIKLTNHI